MIRIHAETQINDFGTLVGHPLDRFKNVWHTSSSAAFTEHSSDNKTNIAVVDDTLYS